MATISSSEHKLQNSILENLTENVVVTDKHFKILECYGSLFRKGKLTMDSFFTFFEGGKEYLNAKITSSEDGACRFSHDFVLDDNEIIHTRIKIVDTKTDDGEFYVFYIINQTKLKSHSKEIMRKFLTIEKLSRSRKVREGRMGEAIYEILELSAKATGIGRINAWLITEDHSEIKCIGNFDSRVNEFIDQQSLPRIAMPNYFSLFETEKIIITSDTYNDPTTEELVDIYLKPNNIRAMMDIPIRSEGEMVGVVCFEYTGETHEWTALEQKFGMVISQMISLVIETHTKHIAQKDLEHAVNEQRILLQEVHHRVKNNLAIVSSLINLQSDKAKDEYHRALFDECRNRLNSIATIHQMLYRSKSFSKINFKDYLAEIVNNLYGSYGSGEKEIVITRNLQEMFLELSQAVPLSLIVNEVITNSFKHAFNNRKKGAIDIQLIAGDVGKRKLIIKDDGPGFEHSKGSDLSLGMDIIEGLAEQIEGKYHYENKKGCVFTLTF